MTEPPDCRCGRPMRIETGKGTWLCLPCDITKEEAITRWKRTEELLKKRDEILNGKEKR